jgi:glyoxylase-like metal-dependent hydrolase (beta-lactamase superfamily II)
MTDGLWEVVTVRYGTRQTVRSEVFLNHFIHGEPDGPIRMDYYFWVVRNAERTLLIDTGYSLAGGTKRRRDFLIDPVEAFEALGVGPATEPTVIVTHAHYDHIGNLARFDRSPIVVGRAELDFWSGPMRDRAQYRYSTEPDEIDALVALCDRGRTTFVDDVLELAPGVTVHQLGGHTAGQLAVAVATSEGELLLTSDAVHYFEELDRDRPFVFLDDLRATYAAFDRVRSLAAQGMRVVPGHDPDVLLRLGGTEHPALPGISSVIGRVA